MRTRTTARGIAATGAALLALTACGGGSDDGGDNNAGDSGSEDKQVNIYGTDGNMGNALGESVAAGLLDTMRGTTPLTDVGTAFQDRLKSVDPALVDYNYAGESYDAVVISALAAEQAKSTAGTDIAANINSVTKDGTKCTSFAECLPLVKAGTDIDYDGITGALNFSDGGEPATGSYGNLVFGPDNKLTTDGYIVVGE